MRMAREVFAQAPLKRFGTLESAPGNDKRSDAELDAFIRATATTVYHPLGTCKMGGARDESAVVDAELRSKASTGCAWLMPRSCPISSAATSTRQ